jgi:hypothetical protein
MATPARAALTPGSQAGCRRFVMGTVLRAFGLVGRETPGSW